LLRAKGDSILVDIDKISIWIFWFRIQKIKFMTRLLKVMKMTIWNSQGIAFMVIFFSTE